MPYIGNTPALDYISFAVQNFTVTAGTTVYTLDYSVSNENDIALYINSVAQRPGSSFAYSATGTTLTLTSATLATDTMYAVFIGRAVQTVTPAAGSVTNTMLSPSVITGQTAETSVAGGDLVLIYDDSATALRKMTRTNFVSGLSVTNTPAFEANLGTNQTVSNDIFTKLQANTEVFDSDNCYDNATNYRFTPTTAGKYFVYCQAFPEGLTTNTLYNPNIAIYKNGSSYAVMNFVSNNATYENTFPITVNCIVDMNGSTDYVEAFGYNDVLSGTPIVSGIRFGAYKLIGA